MASADVGRRHAEDSGLSETDRNRRSASVCDTTLYKPAPLVTSSVPTKGAGGTGGGLRPPLLAGDLLPRTRILLRGQGIYLRDFFINRRGVLFGGPGAFTPTCSEEHLVGFRDQASQIKAAGIDFVGCIYANDPFVLRAWARAKKVQTEFTFISDVEGRLTSALGLLTKGRTRGLGVRPRRFAMVIGLGGTVEWSQVDHHCFAEDVLKFLGVAPLPAPFPPSSAGGELSAAAADVSDDNSENGDLNSDSATENGADETLEDFSSQEILVGRWRSLMLGASVRVDDLTKVPLPNVSLGRGNSTDGTVLLQYDSHPGQHTISHTPGCLRVSVEIGHGMEGFGLLRFDGRNYVATEFHVVGPSPHVLDERAAFPRPIELRIVHQALPGHKDTTRTQLLVVAVTFTPPPLTASERDNVLAINPFLHQVLEIPTLAPDVYEVFMIGRRALPGGGGFGLSSLVPHDASFIKYRGVLSALGERVTWLVMQQSLSLSRMQLQALEQYVRTPACCTETPADALALSHVYRFLPKLRNIRASTGSVIIEALRKKIYIMDELQQTLSHSVFRGISQGGGDTNKWLFAFRQKILEHERELSDLKGLVDRALDVYKISAEEIESMFGEVTSNGAMYLGRFLCSEDVRRLLEGVATDDRDDPLKYLARSVTAPIGSLDALYRVKRQSATSASDDADDGIDNSTSSAHSSKKKQAPSIGSKKSVDFRSLKSNVTDRSKLDRHSNITSSSTSSTESEDSSEEAESSSNGTSVGTSGSSEESSSSDQRHYSKKPVTAVSKKGSKLSSSAIKPKKRPVVDRITEEETSSSEDDSDSRPTNTSEESDTGSEVLETSSSSSSIEERPPARSTPVRRRVVPPPPTSKTKRGASRVTHTSSSSSASSRSSSSSSAAASRSKTMKRAPVPPNLKMQPRKSALKTSVQKSAPKKASKRSTQPTDPQTAKFLTDERIDLVKFMLQQLKRSSSAESVDDVTTANTVANLKATQLSSSELAAIEKHHQKRIVTKHQRTTIRFQDDMQQTNRSSALDSESETDWGALDRKLSREIRLRKRKPTGHPNLGDQVAKMINQMAQTKIRHANGGSHHHEDVRHVPQPSSAKPLKGALKNGCKQISQTSSASSFSSSESEKVTRRRAAQKLKKRFPPPAPRRVRKAPLPPSSTSSEYSSESENESSESMESVSSSASSEQLKSVSRRRSPPSETSSSAGTRSSRGKAESIHATTDDEDSGGEPEWQGQSPWKRRGSPCSSSSDPMTPPKLPLGRGSPSAKNTSPTISKQGIGFNGEKPHSREVEEPSWKVHRKESSTMKESGVSPSRQASPMSSTGLNVPMDSPMKRSSSNRGGSPQPSVYTPSHFSLMTESGDESPACPAFSAAGCADVVVERGQSGVYSTITIDGDSTRLNRREVRKMLNAIRRGGDRALLGVLRKSDRLMEQLEAL